MSLKNKQPGDEKTDALLLEQWYAGNERAFNQLYKRYYGKAVLYCLAMCKDRNKSTEITQNTFIKIVDKVRNNKGKRIEDFAKYLFRSIATNWLEYMRTSKKLQERFTEVNETAMNTATADAGVEQFMANEVQEKILSLLNANEREIYKQHLEGYNYQEIATALELTEGQVRGRIFRMKEIIKNKKDVILDMINGVE